MNPLKASQSTVCGLAWKRYSRQTPLRDVAPALNGRAALPGCGHAERALQASWWQEHGAAHDGGPRAQQAGKLETRALFAGSQGGTVAPAGGNTCAPPSEALVAAAIEAGQPVHRLPSAPPAAVLGVSVADKVSRAA